jgi:uncharacterized protein
MDYPNDLIPQIQHAVIAHSFSANVACETMNAKVVQDADRLEAVGAIGIARCLMTAGSMGQRLYDPDDPFATNRQLDDSKQSIDHFYKKLLRLPESMQTASGRTEAATRVSIMQAFLTQLATEINAPILTFAE